MLVTVLHPGPPPLAEVAEGGRRARATAPSDRLGPLRRRPRDGERAGGRGHGAPAGQPLSATVLKVSGNGSRRGSLPEFLAGVEPPDSR